MPHFTVIYVKGRAVAKGLSIEFEPFPGRSTLAIEAPNKPAAYANAYEHLAKLGLRIFINHDDTDKANPLGLTDSEIESVQAAETPMDIRPTSGIRIEKIIRNR